MKHPLSTVALLSAALMATAAPVLAAPGGHKDSRPVVDCNRGEFPRGPRNFALDIAAKLSAAETYVGITSAQQDAWRAYTSALIAFFDRPAPLPGGGPGPADDLPPPAAPEAGESGKAPPLASETMADRAIDRAEKARSLKAAVEGLRATLSPDQLKRLASAEDALRPQPRGPHGPDGDRGGRHGPDARHDGHGPRDNAGPPPPPAGDDMPPAPAEQ